MWPYFEQPRPSCTKVREVNQPKKKRVAVHMACAAEAKRGPPTVVTWHINDLKNTSFPKKNDVQMVGFVYLWCLPMLPMLRYPLKPVTNPLALETTCSIIYSYSRVSGWMAFFLCFLIENCNPHFCPRTESKIDNAFPQAHCCHDRSSTTTAQ